MTEDQIKHMVGRFLSWTLPEDFTPDNGIEFHPLMNGGTPYVSMRKPSGTNLLSATQAEAMIRYLIDGLPPEKTSMTRRDVAIKILSLNEYDQRKAIEASGVVLNQEEGLLDYEFALKAIVAAERQGLLYDLSDAIDQRRA